MEKANLFSIRFKETRIKRGISQGAMADEMGYNRSAVCDWETRGKEPSFDVLLKICDILNVSADYLLGRDKKQTKYLSNVDCLER